MICPKCKKHQGGQLASSHVAEIIKDGGFCECEPEETSSTDRPYDGKDPWIHHREKSPTHMDF